MRKSELIKENKELKEELGYLKTAYDEMISTFDDIAMPDHSCEPGPYCDACMFKQSVMIRDLFGKRTITYCDYGNKCKNFINKLEAKK